MALPKKYRQKYQKELSVGEQVIFFAWRTMAFLVLYIGIGMSIDLYRFF